MKIDIITVTEEEIRSALRLVWERMKCVIEPSAAVGLAVALKEEFREVSGLTKHVLLVTPLHITMPITGIILLCCAVQKYETADNVGIILCGGR